MRSTEATDLDVPFPLEFIVQGTAVSYRAKRRRSVREWQERVRDASTAALPHGHFATDAAIAATLYYFPDAPMPGDIDNIVKPVLDALCRHVYLDDRQVERLVVQKFEPNSVFAFASPSEMLRNALTGRGPRTYIRLSDDPFEDLR